MLEVKTEKSLPYWLVEILGKYGYRNQTFSKYCSHYAPMKINVVINENQHKGELKNVSKFWNQLVEVNATANIIDVCAAIIAAAVLGGLIFLTYKMTSDEFAFDKNIGLVLFWCLL